MNIIRKLKIGDVLGKDLLNQNERAIIDYLDITFQNNFQSDIDVFNGYDFIYRYDSKNKTLIYSFYIDMDLVSYYSIKKLQDIYKEYLKYRFGVIVEKYGR